MVIFNSYVCLPEGILFFYFLSRLQFLNLQQFMILISNLTMDHVTVWWVQLLSVIWAIYLYMCFCLQIVGVGQHQRPGEPQIYDDLSLVYNWGTYIVLTHGPYSFNDWGCLYLISWSCVPGPKLWIRSSWNQWFSVTETLYEFLGFLFQLQIYSQYYVFIFTMSEYLQLKYNDYRIIEHIIYIIYIHIIYIYNIYIYIILLVCFPIYAFVIIVFQDFPLTCFELERWPGTTATAVGESHWEIHVGHGVSLTHITHGVWEVFRAHLSAWWVNYFRDHPDPSSIHQTHPDGVKNGTIPW